jgi:hypothetical protein
MRLHDWLSEEEGRATRLAAEFGVSRSAVSQWRSVGAPLRCFRRIVELTAGAVSVDDLLSDKEAAAASGQIPLKVTGASPSPSIPTQEPSHAA